MHGEYDNPHDSRDILTMRADFCINVTQFLLNNKIYTLSPSFVEIYKFIKITKLCCFNPDNPPFLSVPSIHW